MLAPLSKMQPSGVDATTHAAPASKAKRQSGRAGAALAAGAGASIALRTRWASSVRNGTFAQPGRAPSGATPGKSSTT